MTKGSGEGESILHNGKILKAMKVEVWDTYVRKPDGTTLHFDILVEEGTPASQVYRFGKEYLSLQGIEDVMLDASTCQFCHVEEVDKDTAQTIRTQGYKVVFLEEIPAQLPVSPSRRDLILYIRAHYPEYRFADFTGYTYAEVWNLLKRLQEEGSLPPVTVKGIDHLNLTVRNLNETIAFYRKVFGFAVIKRMPQHKGAIIGNEAVKLCIYEGENFQQARKDGFNHFGINVDNFEEVERRLRTLGVPILYGGVVHWEQSRSLYIKDPNGYEIEISEKWGGAVEQERAGALSREE